MPVNAVPPGQPVIRRAIAADAEGFLRLFETITASTPFLGFEPGERATAVEAQANTFERQHISLDIHLVACANELPVGFISVLRQFRRKNRHVGSLVMGVHPDWQGAGLGSKLCEAASAQAGAEGITRLELTVVSSNLRAVNLYRAQGFEVEGTRRSSMRCDGQLVDELYMGKLMAA